MLRIRNEHKQPRYSRLYRGQTHVQTTTLNQLAIKLCRKHLSQIMEICSILFDLQTLELISQSLQPSQNPAKDPRGTPEHGTSIPLRRWIWNFDVSSQVIEVVLHINPTYGLEAELGIQIPTEATLGLGHIGKIELHNEHNYIPKRITIPITINPAQLLIK